MEERSHTSLIKEEKKAPERERVVWALASLAGRPEEEGDVEEDN